MARSPNRTQRGRKWLAARAKLGPQWDEVAVTVRGSGLYPLVAQAVDELQSNASEIEDLALAAYLELSLRLRCVRPAETLRDAFVAVSTGTAGQRWTALQAFANQQEAFLREGLEAVGVPLDDSGGMGLLLAKAVGADVIPLAERHREHLAQTQRQVDEEARRQDSDRRRYRQQRTDELQVQFIDANDESDDASVCLYRATMVLRISRNEAAHAKLDQVLHGRLTLRHAFADLVALACVVALRLYLKGISYPQPHHRDVVTPPAGGSWRRAAAAGIAAVALAGAGFSIALARRTGGSAAAQKPPLTAVSSAQVRLEEDRKLGACASAHARFLKDRAGGLIRPFVLTYSRGMPFSVGERSSGVHEERVLEMIYKNELRELVILGGAGIGKSMFAKLVVYGQACLKMPAFLVTVENVYRSGPALAADRNALLDAIARSLSLDAADQRADLSDLLRRQDWLLVLDGLDEASPERRPKLVADVRELADRHRGSLHLVALGRRPLEESPDYGLKVDDILEIPPLTCEQAEGDLRVRMAEQERVRFWDFLKRNRLDKKETGPLPCHYTFIHNFRDMVVLTAMFRGTDRVASLVDATRPEVLRTYVEMRLIEDAPDGRGRHLQRVDDLVTKFWPLDEPKSLARLPPFQASFCREPGESNLCVLESDLFRPRGPGGDFGFKDPSLASLFKARALDRHFSTKKDACSDLDRWLAAEDDAAFLSALPLGERCSEVVRRHAAGVGAK